MNFLAGYNQFTAFVYNISAAWLYNYNPGPRGIKMNIDSRTSKIITTHDGFQF